MGVKFARDYEIIIDELAKLISQITGANEFFDMDSEAWLEIGQEEKTELTKTMADDIFFALGSEDSGPVTVGDCLFEYDKGHHAIKVIDGIKVSLVKLI